MPRVFKIKYRNSWNAYISRSNIVGHNQNRTSTYWILDSINRRATGVPPITVRGLDHRTEEYSHSPATQGRTHSLLNSSEQDNPAVVSNQLPTQPNIKGLLDRDQSCSPVDATHEALLHLPCFSHSRLMRLEVTITFREHIYLRMLIVHLTMF